MNGEHPDKQAQVTKEDESPDVIGPPATMPSRLRWWRYNAGFYCKRLWVCVLCFWYLRHWPWSDLSTAEWRFQLAGETARDAFLEGWCRE